MKIKSDNSGFTLIEIVMVLVLLGIVSVIIITEVSSTDEYELVAQTEVLKSHLRYAQARAMADDGIEWKIHFYADNSYCLFCGESGTPGAKRSLPTSDYEYYCDKLVQMEICLPDLKIDFDDTDIDYVVFDSWGKPVDNDGEPVSGDIKISISHKNSEELKKSITVTAVTGFIK